MEPFRRHLSGLMGLWVYETETGRNQYVHNVAASEPWDVRKDIGGEMERAQMVGRQTLPSWPPVAWQGCTGHYPSSLHVKCNFTGVPVDFSWRL